MYANRACRSAIMVGDPLTQKQMKKISDNLATLKSPWNCPHGRPTMIKLPKLIVNQNVNQYRNVKSINFDD